MTPFVIRKFFGPFSISLFGGVIYSLVYVVPAMESRVQHLELVVISLLVMLTLIVMLFWASAGVFAGLASFLLAMILIYKPLTDLNPYYYSVLILAFFINSFLGQHVYKKINRASQEYTVTMEKLQEDINLIRNHLETRTREVAAKEDKITGLFKLKNIAEELSIALSMEEVIKVVVDRTFDKFGGGTRVAFYVVDEKKREPALFYSAKADFRKPVIMKKGGVFERWAMKNMKGLLVKDARKDFRFSISDAERDDDFVSLILKPLISEGNVTGILRVDSPTEAAFGQHELRILDIIGELAEVALKNARLYRRTEELAIRDSLTGLYVHRYFMERLTEEIKRALRSNSSFAMLMLDIDDFKKFNDKYGHVAGDMILRNVSRILKRKAAAGDIVCRYGGEEFAFIAIDTPRQKAAALARSIKDEIEKSPITVRREKRSVTVSIGIAVFPDDAKLREDLIWEADRQLYQAKARGKNRICLG